MDPDMVKLINNMAGAALQNANREADLRVGRQSDGAAQDMRVSGGFLEQNLFASDEPNRFAGLNAGVRVPTTLEQIGYPGIGATTKAA